MLLCARLIFVINTWNTNSMIQKLPILLINKCYDLTSPVEYTPDMNIYTITFEASYTQLPVCEKTPDGTAHEAVISWLPNRSDP